MNKNIKQLIETVQKFIGNDILSPDDEIIKDNPHADIIREYTYKYYPKTKAELKNYINQLLNEGERNLNCIDVSEITDFSELFYYKSLDMDISRWNVSKGKNFSKMFYGCISLKVDISNWDMSNGTDFTGMFFDCPEDYVRQIAPVVYENCIKKRFKRKYSFRLYDPVRYYLQAQFSPKNNQELQSIVKQYINKGIKDFNDIDVSNITDFSQVFLNQENITDIDIRYWDVSNGEKFDAMFAQAKYFEGDLKLWDVSKGTSFKNMFAGCECFNSDISRWNMERSKTCFCMFSRCLNFNQDLSKWKVGNCINFQYMFNKCEKFNQDLSKWDVSNGDNFFGMFSRCSEFNSDISGWDVSNALTLEYMFYGCTNFNQDLSKWKLVSASNINKIFCKCTNLTYLQKIKNVWRDRYRYHPFLWEDPIS